MTTSTTLSPLPQPLAIRPIRPLFIFILMLCSSAVNAQGCPPSPPNSPPWLLPPAEPFEHHALVNGALISANVYMMDSPVETFRPFVFVEGIDFGLSGGNPPLQNGDFGWTQFWGCDPIGYPMMGTMPDLFDTLIHRGFTPVLIDFENGTANIFDNAELLIDILTHLRDHRTDPRPMVVSGASMGGQLARIALRQMELRGVPTCTSLYVSLDSPHQGANVPLGLQQLLHFLQADGSNTLQALVDALHSPAARQLLLRQVPSLTPRIEYQDSLDVLGLPEDCHNASIANGSLLPLDGAGLPLLHYDHALLESDWLGDIGNLLRLHVHSFPGSSNHPDATASMAVTADVHRPSNQNWPWPLLEGTAYASPSDLDILGALDQLPGGTRPSMHQFALAFNQHIQSLDLPWPACIPPIEGDEFVSHHSFIPTLSALDIPPPWTSSMDTGSLGVSSPFDAVHIASSNEAHSEVNTANIAFIVGQLEHSDCPVSPNAQVADTILVAAGAWRLSPLVCIGRLGLHSADTALCQPAAPPQSHGEFNMDGCSGAFQVESEGTLELGGGSGPGLESTARLVLSHGAVLDIEGGLIVHSGSELVVGAGALLRLSDASVEIESGGRILLHSNAKLEIQGDLNWTQAPHTRTNLDGLVELAPNAAWQAHFMGNAMVSTQFHLELVGGENSEINLHSSSESALWLLAQHAEVTVSGATSWDWDKVGVRMSGHGRFSLTSSALQNWSSGWSGTSTDSLVLCGDVALNAHTLDFIHLRHSGGFLYSTGSQFDHGTTRTEGRLNLQHCDFHRHSITIQNENNTAPHLLQNCSFDSGPLGIQAATFSTLRLEDCLFERLRVAVEGRSTRCELACCQFHDNDVAVLVNRSLLAMTPAEGGGWNQFENNDVHLRFLQAPVPLWIDGANLFGNWGSAWAQGSFSLGCQGPVDILATGQTWGWPSGWPQIQGGLWAVSPSGIECPVQVIDLSPVEAQGCRMGLKNNKE